MVLVVRAGLVAGSWLPSYTAHLGTACSIVSSRRMERRGMDTGKQVTRRFEAIHACLRSAGARGLSLIGLRPLAPLCVPLSQKEGQFGRTDKNGKQVTSLCK